MRKTSRLGPPAFAKRPLKAAMQEPNRKLNGLTHGDWTACVDDDVDDHQVVLLDNPGDESLAVQKRTEGCSRTRSASAPTLASVRFSASLKPKSGLPDFKADCSSSLITDASGTLVSGSSRHAAGRPQAVIIR